MGTLLGCALGDALGLAAEGLSAAAIARRFGRVERFHLLGNIGFVSDDTEQSALVAQSLLRGGGDVLKCARAFRWALLGWFLRLPWGIGMATVRACLRIAVGLTRSGVRSAGNGAAMRAAVVGTFFRDDPEARRRFGTALAETTHVDARGVQGALFSGELAAAAASQPAGGSPVACFSAARAVVVEPSLGAALDLAAALAAQGKSAGAAALVLGTSGFVVHSVPFAAFCFLRFGTDAATALTETICAGGDTDTNAAMVGAWAGALHGEKGLPSPLIARLAQGPFGPAHLRALAGALVELREGRRPARVTYSAVLALARNLALYPVILAHGFRRLVPF